MVTKLQKAYFAAWPQQDSSCPSSHLTGLDLDRESRQSHPTGLIMPKLALDGGKPVRSRTNFLVFGAPPLGDDEIAGVTDSLRRRWIGTGPKVAAFEAAFAAYKGVDAAHAVAVNSCTAALHLSILAL